MMIDAVNIDNFQYFWKYLSGSRFEGGRRMPPYIKMQLQSLFQPSWNQKKPFQSNLSLRLTYIFYPKTTLKMGLIAFEEVH